MENISIKISTSINQGIKNSTIVLEGNLCIENGQKIKKNVLKTLSENDNVKVIMKNVSDIDLYVFQLFFNLKRT